ncbi:uncharacterized protein BDZ99DRAFT_456585, partial [Mytilinidion resinicola]
MKSVPTVLVLPVVFGCIPDSSAVRSTVYYGIDQEAVKGCELVELLHLLSVLLSWRRRF